MIRLPSYNFILIVCVASLFMPLILDADGGDIRHEIAIHKKSIDDLEVKIRELNVEVLSQRNIIKANEDAYGTAKADEKYARENKGKSWTGEQEHDAALKKVITINETLIKSKETLQSIFDARNDAYVEIERLDKLIDKLDALPAPKGEDGIIGITIDNTCRTFIKNNLTSSCPSFELIDTLYPGSVCNYVESSCVDYYRQIGGFYYLIDPPALVVERIRMVEIRYSFEEFHIQGSEGFDNENRTINYQVGRYMDGCKTAYIGSDSWMKYTGDSIYLLWKGCGSQYTNLDNEIRSVSLNSTKFDISTSYKWQLDNWIKESLEKCREKCFEY